MVKNGLNIRSKLPVFREICKEFRQVLNSIIANFAFIVICSAIYNFRVEGWCDMATEKPKGIENIFLFTFNANGIWLAEMNSNLPEKIAHVIWMTCSRRFDIEYALIKIQLCIYWKPVNSISNYCVTISKDENLYDKKTQLTDSKMYRVSFVRHVFLPLCRWNTPYSFPKLSWYIALLVLHDCQQSQSNANEFYSKVFGIPTKKISFAIIGKNVRKQHIPRNIRYFWLNR